ncbi:MAG: hypothetical protein CNE98_04805 [Bacteroidetes bacterium MED-G17]|nr:MAG: hypothetical protein CBB99_04210 [Bacteroidetes bacterium TMED39]PDH52368.1 MAG: hypothetical protein CNE98_04805 [Bacteroidetes bacterium MED-G17]CAI8258492.1 MAG: Uncharacterised protein [Bacteroidetes bacterium MED-G17]
MNQFVYLGLLIFTLYYPLRKWYDSRVKLDKKWKDFLLSTLITAIIFILWDIWFTEEGIWGFNNNYFLGIRIWLLPIEEILFFFVIPLACIFIYEVCKFYFPNGLNKHITFSLHLAFFLIALYNYTYFQDQLYTNVTAILQLVLTVSTMVLFKKIKLPHFYYGYFFSLIPFFLVNGVLTKLPVVWYNDLENMNIRMGSIPLDDAFYLYDLLLLNIFLLEIFRKFGNPLRK